MACTEERQGGRDANKNVACIAAVLHNDAALTRERDTAELLLFRARRQLSPCFFSLGA